MSKQIRKAVAVLAVAGASAVAFPLAAEARHGSDDAARNRVEHVRGDAADDRGRRRHRHGNRRHDDGPRHEAEHAAGHR